MAFNTIGMKGVVSKWFICIFARLIAYKAFAPVVVVNIFSPIFLVHYTCHQLCSVTIEHNGRSDSMLLLMW